MRLLSFDVLRIIAVNCVIYIHTSQYYLLNNQYLNPKTIALSVINNLTRFAVPFFFISSGYFLGEKINKGGEPRGIILKYIKRLSTLLIPWSIIYLIIPTDLSQLKKIGLLQIVAIKVFLTSQWIINNLLAFALRSTSVHLWFLIALALSCIILLFAYTSANGFLILSVFMYIVGILGGAYSVSSIAIKIPFDTNLSFLISTIFVSMGYWLSKKDTTVNITVVLIIVLCGASLHLIESYLLFKNYKSSLIQSNLFGTALFSAGVALLAVRYKQVHLSKAITTLSKYSIGVYLSHVLVILFVVNNTTFWKSESLCIFFVFNFSIYLISLALTLLLSKIPLVKYLVQ